MNSYREKYKEYGHEVKGVRMNIKGQHLLEGRKSNSSGKEKGNRKKSTGGINGKRNIRRHIGPLLSAEEKIKANDTEEAEPQNAFFGSLFTMTSVEIKQREMVQTEAKRKVQEIEIC